MMSAHVWLLSHSHVWQVHVQNPAQLYQFVINICDWLWFLICSKHKLAKTSAGVEIKYVIECDSPHQTTCTDTVKLLQLTSRFAWPVHIFDVDAWYWLTCLIQILLKTCAGVGIKHVIWFDWQCQTTCKDTVKPIQHTSRVAWPVKYSMFDVAAWYGLTCLIWFRLLDSCIGSVCYN